MTPNDGREAERTAKDNVCFFHQNRKYSECDQN